MYIIKLVLIFTCIIAVMKFNKPLYLSISFNSRRVNAMVAPFIIGLLPSAGAILIVALSSLCIGVRPHNSKGKWIIW